MRSEFCPELWLPPGSAQGQLGALWTMEGVRARGFGWALRSLPAQARVQSLCSVGLSQLWRCVEGLVSTLSADRSWCFLQEPPKPSPPRKPLPADPLGRARPGPAVPGQPRALPHLTPARSVLILVPWHLTLLCFPSVCNPAVLWCNSKLHRV